MSYVDVIYCPSLRKADNKRIGFPFHAAPRMVKIISNAMLASAFSNDVILLTLIWTLGFPTEIWSCAIIGA